MDRFLAIYLSLRYCQVMTVGRVKVTIGLIYVWNLCVAILPAAGWNEWGKKRHCHLPLIFTSTYIIVFCLGVTIGIFMMSILNLLLFAIASKHRRQIQALDVSRDHRGALRLDLQGTKSVLLVIGLFIVCYLPWALMLIYMLLTTRYNFDPTFLRLYDATTLLLTLNSGVNPLVYATRMKPFRLAFKSMLTCYSSNRVHRFHSRDSG